MNRILFLLLTSLPLIVTDSVTAQDDTKLIVRRVSIANFLKDPILSNLLGKKQGSETVLPSTFVLTSPDTGQSIYWSPVLCRLLAVKNGMSTPTFKELDAEGTHPLSFSLGVLGKPKFFGFRLVDGNPEFLYTYGQLSIEEKFQLTKDGKKLLHSFKVNTNALDGSYRFSESWRELVTADNGRWRNNVLALTNEEMAEGFTITYYLDPSSR